MPDGVNTGQNTGVNTGPAPPLPMPPDQLELWFAGRLGVADVTITDTGLLPGGAIQHNWRIDLEIGGQAQACVLRAGPHMPLPESLSKAEEFDILRLADARDVPVAAPLWLHDGAAPFFVSRLCPGNAGRDGMIGRRDNAALLGDLGAALARIHAVDPPPDARRESPLMRIETLTTWMQELACGPGGVGAGVSISLAWLRAHAPEATQAVLVHRDFRTGNFLVENGRLQAILDWEFAGWGDPHEDIGWFCAQCWRGDALDREAGGLGDRDAFYDAYVAAGGDAPEPDRVRFWEVFAHLRWAIIALQQGARARAGAYPAWELEEAEARVPGLLRTIAEMIR